MFSLEPRCQGDFGVTEEHLDAGIDSECGVLGHLCALIPCQRLPQMFRKFLDGVSQCDPDIFGFVAFRNPEQHQVSGLAFDQGSDSRLSCSDDEVAFPVAGNGTVFDLGGTLTDHDHVPDLALG